MKTIDDEQTTKILAFLGEQKTADALWTLTEIVKETGLPWGEVSPRVFALVDVKRIDYAPPTDQRPAAFHMPEDKRPLTQEQIDEALGYVATRCGRSWKSALRTAWEAGTLADVAGTPERASHLQRLRNMESFGPRGLVKYKLPKPAPTCCRWHAGGGASGSACMIFSPAEAEGSSARGKLVVAREEIAKERGIPEAEVPGWEAGFRAWAR